GIGILAGPLLGVLLVQGVPAFIPVESLALVASRVGLLLLILYFPGGIVQLVAPLRDRVITFIGKLAGVTADETPDERGDAELFSDVSLQRRRTAADPGKVSDTEKLTVRDVTKSYGGLRAVDDVSVTVYEG